MQTSQATATLPQVDLESQVVPALQESLQSLARLNERTLTYIRERPLTCIVVAGALRYAVVKMSWRCAP